MTLPQPLFADRGEAGRLLAERLAGRVLGNAVVYALPRGGVPVALESVCGRLLVGGRLTTGLR
jgi:predicted phosphoribosyltransferase